MPLLDSNLKNIDVQVSEQTEKARTDSTGSPDDPDFIFFKFLKNAFRQSKISVSIAHTIFAIDSNIGIFAEYDHRLKFTNVVADQKHVFLLVLVNVFAIVACPM